MRGLFFSPLSRAEKLQQNICAEQSRHRAEQNGIHYARRNRMSEKVKIYVNRVFYFGKNPLRPTERFHFGKNARKRMFSQKVLFPAPFTPKKANSSPFFTQKLSLFTA